MEMMKPAKADYSPKTWLLKRKNHQIILLFPFLFQNIFQEIVSPLLTSSILFVGLEQSTLFMYFKT